MIYLYIFISTSFFFKKNRNQNQSNNKCDNKNKFMDLLLLIYLCANLLLQEGASSYYIPSIDSHYTESSNIRKAKAKKRQHYKRRNYIIIQLILEYKANVIFQWIYNVFYIDFHTLTVAIKIILLINLSKKGAKHSLEMGRKVFCKKETPYY